MLLNNFINRESRDRTGDMILTYIELFHFPTNQHFQPGETNQWNHQAWMAGPKSCQPSTEHVQSFQQFVWTSPQFLFNSWPLNHSDILMSISDITAIFWVLKCQWIVKKKPDISLRRKNKSCILWLQVLFFLLWWWCEEEWLPISVGINNYHSQNMSIAWT